ncbi:MAG: SDR family NAD(P)-dependent oxidoreductase [Phycisphaerales bacterium]
MPTTLITGANRGIGLAFARALTARGDNVIGTARDPDRAGTLRETGARVVQLDVCDKHSVRARRPPRRRARRRPDQQRRRLCR